MALRLGSTVINCAEVEVMTTFWCAVLGLVPETTDPADDFRVLRGDPASISLQLATTPVSARDQMHLDLYTDEKAGEVARVVGLGARWVRSSGDPDDDYDVLLDPEGNEFCIIHVAP
jgi:hypothetical protein